MQLSRPSLSIEITTERNRRAIAWFPTSTLNDACLIRSLSCDLVQFHLPCPIILGGEKERPSNRTFLPIQTQPLGPCAAGLEPIGANTESSLLACIASSQSGRKLWMLRMLENPSCWQLFSCQLYSLQRTSSHVVEIKHGNLEVYYQ